MPLRKYEERKRACVSLPSIVRNESSQVSLDDRFAALQIDLGWRCVTPAYRLTVSRSSFPLQFTSEVLISLAEQFIMRARVNKVQHERLLDFFVNEQPIALATIDMALPLPNSAAFQRMVLVFGRQRCSSLQNRNDGVQQRKVEPTLGRTLARPFVGRRKKE